MYKQAGVNPGTQPRAGLGHDVKIPYHAWSQGRKKHQSGRIPAPSEQGNEKCQDSALISSVDNANAFADALSACVLPFAARAGACRGIVVFGPDTAPLSPPD